MAVNTLHATNGLFDGHSFQQGTQSLSVSMATAYHLRLGDPAIFYIHHHQFGANAPLRNTRNLLFHVYIFLLNEGAKVQI